MGVEGKRSRPRSAEAALEREVSHRGWQLVDVCRDEAMSGRSLVGRPTLDWALRAVESCGAEVLVVAKLDRLSRRRYCGGPPWTPADWLRWLHEWVHNLLGNPPRVTDLTLWSMPSDADAITRDEAARILAVHVATVDRMIRRGVLVQPRDAAAAA